MWKNILKKDIRDILDAMKNAPYNEEFELPHTHPLASMTISNFDEVKEEYLSPEIPENEMENAADKIVEEYYATLTLNQIKDDNFDFDKHLLKTIENYKKRLKYNDKFQRLNKGE